MRVIEIKQFCVSCKKEVKPSDLKRKDGISNFIMTGLCDKCAKGLRTTKPGHSTDFRQT